MRPCLAVLCVFLLACPAHADPIPVAERTVAIQHIIKALNTSYIYPEKAKALEPALLHADLGKPMSDEAFATSVTRIFEAVTKDPHLRLLYSAEPAPEQRQDTPAAPDRARQQAYLREQNYGIERVERLPGNIGYLKTGFFAPAADSAPFIGAAMTLLANTDALIVDLRDNDGGSVDGVPLLASYLFDDRTHLADIYRREGNITEQQWTSPAVPGSRFGGVKAVYILTSKATFSAAEGLAFALQNRGRALIVGETTRGGAHPSRVMPIGAQFELMVPTSTARDPVTLKDWEGVGVVPDIAVPAAQALTRAQVAILTKLRASKQAPELQAEVGRRLEELRLSH